MWYIHTYIHTYIHRLGTRARFPRSSFPRRAQKSSQQVVIRHVECGRLTQGSAYRFWKDIWMRFFRARLIMRVILSSLGRRTTRAGYGKLRLVCVCVCIYMYVCMYMRSAMRVILSSRGRRTVRAGYGKLRLVCVYVCVYTCMYVCICVHL